jgi:hypothetical protein
MFGKPAAVKTVAADAHAVVILDGAGWHYSHGLVVPSNITLLGVYGGMNENFVLVAGRSRWQADGV